MILRETDWFIAERAKKGVRIIAKEKGVTPKSRIVSFAIWEQLEQMNDNEFNGSIALDLGIGVFHR